MDKKFLLLWLEAPLQSWGSNSKFGRRDTQRFPTKSGIYGLFLSALGAKGPQVELLQRLAAYKQWVVSYIPEHEKENGFSKRNNLFESKTVLMDFQMVGSGYDDRDSWQKLLIPKKSDGSPAVGGGSKMTYRYYLQDARFAVIQELDESLSNEIGDALQNPVYDLFLGRKNCVPTDFIYRGSFSTYEEAYAQASAIAKEKNLAVEFEVREEDNNSENCDVLSDVPIRFGDVKLYRDRCVSLEYKNGNS